MDEVEVSISTDRLRQFIDQAGITDGRKFQELHNAVDNLWIAYTQQRDNAQLGHELLGEYIIQHIAEPADRARVEVRENAQGKAAISIRLTVNDPVKATQDALAFYWSTRDQLDEGGIG